MAGAVPQLCKAAGDDEPAARFEAGEQPAWQQPVQLGGSQRVVHKQQHRACSQQVPQAREQLRCVCRIVDARGPQLLQRADQVPLRLLALGVVGVQADYCTLGKGLR
jgi:hypothetical protein